MPEKQNNGMDKNKLVRVGVEFNKEIEFIKNKRLEIGKDKKKKSTKILTNIIIKHNFWKEMKKDIINIKIERVKSSGRNTDE